MELRDQVYNLGQIYARLCKVVNMDNLSNPQSYERACRQPLKEITIIVQKLRGKIPKKDEEYIAIRFNDIDIDNDIIFGGTLPIELQGVFQIAYHQARNPKSVKELIAGSGYNQNEVADLLGVNINTVSRWALGEVIPSVEVYYKLERLKKEK